MFDSSNIIVGLEIGTSKVCAVVGELSDEGALNIIGIGQAKSNGVRKSEIVELHFFGGLSYDETAAAVGLSPATIDRELRLAKAWIRVDLEGGAS